VRRLGQERWFRAPEGAAARLGVPAHWYGGRLLLAFVAAAEDRGLTVAVMR
jgi:hypothetical protein